MKRSHRRKTPDSICRYLAGVTALVVTRRLRSLFAANRGSIAVPILAVTCRFWPGTVQRQLTGAHCFAPSRAELKA
jgi:hypothetical protein